MELENKDIFEISEILLKDTKHILKDISGHSLEELLEVFPSIVKGEIAGRVLVDVSK